MSDIHKQLKTCTNSLLNQGTGEIILNNTITGSESVDV